MSERCFGKKKRLEREKKRKTANESLNKKRQLIVNTLDQAAAAVTTTISISSNIKTKILRRQTNVNDKDDVSYTNCVFQKLESIIKN